jgi:phage-related minor tail protein
VASRTLQVIIAGDARGAQGAFTAVEKGSDSLSTKLDNVGQKMMGFGTKMTLGVTLPLALVGKASFDAASDLNESL